MVYDQLVRYDHHYPTNLHKTTFWCKESLLLPFNCFPIQDFDCNKISFKFPLQQYHSPKPCKLTLFLISSQQKFKLFAARVQRVHTLKYIFDHPRWCFITCGRQYFWSRPGSFSWAWLSLLDTQTSLKTPGTNSVKEVSARRLAVFVALKIEL